MRFAEFAKSAATALLFAVALAAPAHAQINKQVISGTWYEDRATANGNTNSLILTLTQVPANKFLNITHVACTIATQTSQVLDRVDLNTGSTSGNSDLGRSYPLRGNVSPQVVASANSWSVVTDKVYFKIGPGRYPSISISTYSSGGATPYVTASCVVVGDLSDS
ncbi:hypothetical protein JQ594_25970 [Bradyrhizobium manausense]|uniref:hypothetical protein n=1 Tax=Bradyrhizobium manausense TaxID=989370 RepID=UPI001BAE2D0A|nr:hypothetical protein [Bradyrhizobium manausense]MBR0689390.1 hypothetical protein [Bradyrhizobium manausense]